MRRRAVDIRRISPRSIEHRLQIIAKMIRQGAQMPEIRKLALRILQNVKERDKVAEAEAIFSFMAKNIRYCKDPVNVDLFQSADLTLDWRGGDCDDHVILGGALLRTIGFNQKVKAISIRGAGFDHVFLQTEIDGNWIAFDTSSKKHLGWEAQHLFANAIDV